MISGNRACASPSRLCPFRPLGEDNNSGRVEDSASGRQRLGGTANNNQLPTGAGGGGRGRRANDRDGVDGPTASERLATDGRWTARVGREHRRWRGMDGDQQQPTIDGGGARGRQTTHSPPHTRPKREDRDFFSFNIFLSQEPCFAVRRKGFLTPPPQQPINKLFTPRDGMDARPLADSRPSPRIAETPPSSQM